MGPGLHDIVETQHHRDAVGELGGQHGRRGVGVAHAVLGLHDLMDLGVEIGADDAGRGHCIDHRAVGVGAQDGEAGALQGGGDPVVIGLRGAKARGELRRRQEPVESGRRGRALLLDEVIEPWLVAIVQGDGECDRRGGRSGAQVGDVGPKDGAGGELLLLSARGRADGHQGGAREQGRTEGEGFHVVVSECLRLYDRMGSPDRPTFAMSPRPGQRPGPRATPEIASDSNI